MCACVCDVCSSFDAKEGEERQRDKESMSFKGGSYGAVWAGLKKNVVVVFF